MPISDVMTDEELKRRYDSLPELPEIPGERTFISRCYDWEMFCDRVARVAAGFRASNQKQRDLQRSFAPELYDLIVEAFPS